MTTSSRRLLWVSLPDQRAGREVTWLSMMPNTRVTALAAHQPAGNLGWVRATYRRPITRFVEAGAFAWVREISDEDPRDYDWVASLELCSLVTGQASRWRSAARRAGVRSLQAVLTWENLPGQPLYRLPFYRQALESTREADLFLCFIDAARDHLIANDFPSELIRVVKPGCDLDRFTPAAEPTEEPIIAFVSPLAANKGIDRVLEAMRLLRHSIPEARLVVAGKGPLEARVAAVAADPREQVTYLGALDADGVADVLRGAAIFTTAPRPTWKWTEQFGLAYLEAMACGLPIVTTTCGTNREAVTADNQLVEDSAEALAAAYGAILHDRDHRVEVGRRNRAHVELHHDLRTQSTAMDAAFREMEGRHSSGHP